MVHRALNPVEMTTKYVKNQRRMVVHLKEVYQMSTEPSIVNISGQGKAEISFLDDVLRDHGRSVSLLDTERNHGDQRRSRLSTAKELGIRQLIVHCDS